MIPDLKHEMWFAEKVTGEKPCHLFLGVTDVAERRKRVRAAILERGLGGQLCGKTATYGEAFIRLYGQSLTKDEG